tara:strand:- start:1325 stop:2956 length:1632 start_codon:yes stop_codon:yes gene_type:complete
MNNIILTNCPDFFVDVNEKFTYNYYNNKETLTNDRLIINNIKNPYRFIELSIKTRSKYDVRLFDFVSNLNLEDIENMSNKNLSTSDLIFFNKIHKLDTNMKNINMDKDSLEIKKINSFFDINEISFNKAINFISSNKKISIARTFYEEVIESNKENIFFTSKNKENLEDYDHLIDDKDNDVVENFNSLTINNGFNVYQKISVHSNLKNIPNYYLNIGFLIEKYKLDDAKYTKIASYFNYNSSNKNILSLNKNNESNTITYNFSLKDSGVKYGSTYKYVVYPVYITSIPTKSDYHTYDQYIVCGYPYITKKIDCKESKRPISPSQIYFKYNHHKEALCLNWNIPLEEQGDIKGYQIFKRFSLNDPFVLIKQIEFHNSSDFYERNQNVSSQIIENIRNKNITEYFDNNFKLDKIQIYSICSIDAHGFTSNYSSQYAIRYDHSTKKCLVDLISNPGAPLHMPNLLIPRKTKFFDNDDYIAVNTPIEEKVKKFTLYVTPEYNRININMGTHKTVLNDSYKLSIFKVENSSTHTSDIKIVNFNNENFI